MDKKAKYSQSSAKGAAGDSKKSQDVANSKLFPKAPRKREPPGASNFAKYDHPRNCNVQKARNVDKRPKPKGLYHGSSKEDSKVVNEEFAEVGTVWFQGSKKQNLNHLLNFHYGPRDVHGSNTWSHGKASNGYSRHDNRWLPPIQRHKYNKEQFLQASCQFVVTADKDYTLHLTDPDILVDWTLIEQIKLYSQEKLSCPICLCAPVAGKITRCGHVYCWPCILHYLSLSDKTWRKCPICYESVHKSDLKSVVEVNQTTFNLGDTISLRLMRREKGSLIAVPVSNHPTPAPTMFLSLSDRNNAEVYSKLLLASVQDVQNIIEWERVLLKLEMNDNPQSPENCFIEEALNELQKREEGLAKKKEKTEVVNEPVVEADQGETLSDQNQEKEPKQRECYEEANDTCESENAQLLDDPTIAGGTASNACPNSSSSKFFYFYQADDGQHMYLHAMNIKMLELQYGNLEHCPHTITGKLLEKESGSCTEELRRRMRYLCHLPITSQFELVEIELTPPIVSEEVLHSFREQLDTRQRRRQRRERDERKRDKKITEEVNKQMGRYPTPNVQIESRQHFPEWQPEILFAEDCVQESPTESIATSSIASSPSQSTFEELAASSPTETQPAQPTQPIQVVQSTFYEEFHQGPSFAEMLRNKAANSRTGPAWPSIRSSRTRSRSGTELQSTSRDNDEDTSAPTPWHNLSLGDALAKQLERAKLIQAATKMNGSGGRKQKKKQANCFVRN